jgi:hypothetical protein
MQALPVEKNGRLYYSIFNMFGMITGGGII